MGQSLSLLYLCFGQISMLPSFPYLMPWLECHVSGDALTGHLLLPLLQVILTVLCLPVPACELQEGGVLCLRVGDGLL